MRLTVGRLPQAGRQGGEGRPGAAADRAVGPVDQLRLPELQVRCRVSVRGRPAEGVQGPGERPDRRRPTARPQEARQAAAGLSERQALKFLQSYVDPVKYAHLVEGGRKPVRATRKKVLSGGGVVYGTHAFGVQPRPFVAPAAAAVAGSAGEMAADVRDGIDREAARYAAKGKGIRG